MDYGKIDGVFIRAIDNSEVDEAMVKAISRVARVIGTQTIAEFVANREGFDTLDKIAQGYWIEKPRPIAGVFQSPRDAERRALRLVGSE